MACHYGHIGVVKGMINAIAKTICQDDQSIQLDAMTEKLVDLVTYLCAEVNRALRNSNKYNSFLSHFTEIYSLKNVKDFKVLLEKTKETASEFGHTQKRVYDLLL